MAKVLSLEAKVLGVGLLLVCGLAGAEPTAYMDMVLRARNAADARERLGITNGTGGTFTQTNISYTSVTNAPWLNTNKVVASVVWTRVAAWSNTVYVPNASFDSNGVLAQFTADGGMYRVDNTRLLSTPVLGQYNDYEEHLGLFWTNQVGERMDLLLSDNYSGAIIASTPSYNHYLQSGMLVIRPQAGALVTITNRARITGSNDVGGTNYLGLEVAHPQTIYGVTP